MALIDIFDVVFGQFACSSQFSSRLVLKLLRCVNGESYNRRVPRSEFKGGHRGLEDLFLTIGFGGSSVTLFSLWALLCMCDYSTYKCMMPVL